MKTSANGIALIKRFEGLELDAYKDVAGIWTIGYGHTGPVDGVSVHAGMKISEAAADAILIEDLAAREKALTGWAINAGVELNQNEFDALVAFVFNIGFDNFRRKSGVARELARGNHAAAAEWFGAWNKATVNGKLIEVAGLTRRRAAERALFLAPPAETPNNPDAPSYRLAGDTRLAPSTPSIAPLLRLPRLWRKP